MASTPPAPNRDNSDGPCSSSYFQKTVCLQDWWLINAEKDFQGKKLAVAGRTSREQQAVREFSSAPIIKRFDVFTLETADGIWVRIKGFINKERTKENGFPSDVFDHFLFGFPPDWEKYAEKCVRGFSNEDIVSKSILGHDKLSTDSGVDNSDEMYFSLEECDCMLSTTGPHEPQDSACNDSSVGDPEIRSSQVSEMIIGASNGSDLQNHVTDSVRGEFPVKIGSDISNTGSKSTVQRYSSASKNEVCPDATAVPVNSNVHEVHDNTTEHPPLSSHSGRSTINLFDVDVVEQQKHLGHRSTRSCKRTDVSKSNGKGKKRTEQQSERKSLENVKIWNDNVNLNANQLENAVSNVESKSGGRSIFILSEDGLQQPMDDQKEQMHEDQMNRAGKQNKALRSSIGYGDANQKDVLQTEPCKVEANAKEASTSRKKTKRKLTYESPVTQGGTKQTPFVSSDSLSFKRSKSGRLLLPTLEFWRNQMAIYDADRKVTGIQEGLRRIEPSRGSRGSRSEPQRKRNQLR